MNDNLNETNIQNTLDVVESFLDPSQQQVTTEMMGKFIFSNFLPKIAKSFHTRF